MAAKRASRLPFVLLIAGLMIGGLVLLLALNTASAANELRRSSLATKDQEVSADVAQLRNEVAASAAPANLARAAGELGMVPAGHAAFIVELPNGQTVLRGHAGRVTDDPLDIPSGTVHVAPKPTTRASASSTSPAKSTTSATSTKRPATSSTSAKSSKASGKSTKTPAKSSKSSAKSTPSSTPTPTITLPGGTR